MSENLTRFFRRTFPGLFISIVLLFSLPATGDSDLTFFPRYSYSILDVYDGENLKLLVVSSSSNIGGDLHYNYRWSNKHSIWMRIGAWHVQWAEPHGYTVLGANSYMFAASAGYSRDLSNRLQYTLSITEAQVPTILYAGATASRIDYPFWLAPGFGMTLRFLQLGPLAFKIKGQAGLYFETTNAFAGNLNFWTGSSLWTDFQIGRWGYWIGGYLNGDILNAGNYTQNKSEIGVRLAITLNFPNCARCKIPVTGLNRSF